MRAIKFKAKVKYNGNHYFAGEWVFGHYHQNENGEHLIFDNEENYIANIGDFTAYEDVEIDPNTLGQYTGHKDKNGVDIYDGDVVLLNGVKRIVFFDLTIMGAFRVTTPDLRDDCEWHPRMFLYWYYECAMPDIEVIGNIHDKEKANESD